MNNSLIDLLDGLFALLEFFSSYDQLSKKYGPGKGCLIMVLLIVILGGGLFWLVSLTIQ